MSGLKRVPGRVVEICEGCPVSVGLGDAVGMDSVGMHVK